MDLYQRGTRDQGDNGDRLDLLIRDCNSNRYTGYEFKAELATAEDFDKAFDQANKYLSMLELDVFLVNFASKNKKRQLPPPRCGTDHPNLKVLFVNMLYDGTFTGFQICQHGMETEVIRAIGQ